MRVLAGAVDSPRLKKSPRRFPKPRSLGALAPADICILVSLVTGQIVQKIEKVAKHEITALKEIKKTLYELTKMSRM